MKGALNQRRRQQLTRRRNHLLVVEIQLQEVVKVFAVSISIEVE